VPSPTVSSITPSTGLAVGDVFAQIVGTGFNLSAQGSVSVTFGGAPAVKVAVLSSTLLHVAAPAGDPDAGATPGAVDVVVTNRDPDGNPQGSATLVKGFTYRRGSIALPSDLSGHSAIALVTRALVREFQRAVLKNTKHDLHSEYASEVDASAGETARAVAPSLKILGPRIAEDRWNSVNENRLVDLGSPNWLETFKTATVMLTYDIVGVARDPVEAANLWTEIQRYFDHNDYLRVVVASSKLGSEVAVYELQPLWEQRGEFRSKATRQALYQFSESFVVRGVSLCPDSAFAAGVDAVRANLSFYQLPEAQQVPADGVPVETLEVVLPSGQDLQTTLAQLEGSIAELQREAPLSIPFDFSSSSPLALSQLLPGDIVDQVKVVIEAGFDDPAATLRVGTTQDPDLVFAAGEVACQTLGDYESEQDFKIGTATSLVLTIARGASTRGSGFVLIRLRK
jgi:hypothetical protein